MKKKGEDLIKGNYIIQNKEKLLHKRKKNKKIRVLMLLVIIMISTLITLCIKLPYFNITSIEITGNNNSSKDEIYDTAKVHLGSNILYENFNDSKKQIMKNPYIVGVKVKKGLPSKITIQVQEKVAVFYGKVNNDYYILDNNGILLEKRSNIKNMNLVKLIGFNYQKTEVGQLVGSKNDRRINIIKDITNIINEYRKANRDSDITMVDVSNVIDVKVFTGEMCIKFGTTDDLKDKFNKAINIITQLKYQGAKGYVDVSFTGNPVVIIEKK
ncbi:FtsQ-type POTRA domain-containing protein [Clostridium algoriphilum]|uniref:cell division protein FtsQ/DivIB n=1 Tax=Clostridium algoriphilum TaxID=198347 RepID=UPI001CF5778D|nr:FtsQ-type POTRA domain-containing protein [Clostridium algoriphilum]MCB2291954.1 FtsQ-type POTRA domain-containing protein [Clostridium algoriphilum]